MASKRKLKKHIIALATTLFEDALCLRALSTDNVISKIETFMEDIIVFTDDTIRRIHNPDGKNSPSLVKKYYRNLITDIQNKIEIFNLRLESLSRES